MTYAYFPTGYSLASGRNHFLYNIDEKNVPTKYFIPRSTLLTARGEWRRYPDPGDAKKVVGDLVHGEAAQGFPRRSMHSIIKN
jgi:hypothetical protein